MQDQKVEAHRLTVGPDGITNATTQASTRKSAAQALTELAKQQRLLAADRMQRARRVFELLLEAETLLQKADELDDLAKHAIGLTGDAERALWAIVQAHGR